MGRILGIDLGTTNSLVATVDSGFPYVIADVQGNRLTPSVVHLPGGDEGPVVGYPAKRLQVVKPSETIYSIKRFMGRRASEIPREEMLVTYPVRGHENGAVTIDVHGRSWTPEAVSAEILRKLKSDAEQALDEAVDRAVITVPAYFNDAQRNATKRAGEQAGLTVERIVNEPTAAALAYGVDRLKTAVRIAVYDLGGGTFDLTILELKEGVFQVLATCGNTRLGGDDLDTRLVGLLNRRIREAGGPETASDPGLQSRLREAAEEAKVRLSTMEAVDVTLPFLTENFSFEYRLTRKELEETTRDIIASTRSYCQRALADAQLEARDLDQVILVGGQTRMPLVRQTVAEFFGCVEEDHAKGSLSMSDSGAESRKGPQLNTSQNPEEAVAIGAAIQGEILAGRMDHLLLLDVTPLSLGIETYGGLMNVLIPRNTTIPVKSGEMFTTAVDNQQSMLIHILQGEREKAKDNWSLGQFNLEFEPAPKGVARVGVQFELDANGILHVLARDTKTGQERRVEVTSAVDVQDETVQQMVEESAEHAFADLRARQWVETKMRAQETLAATRNGLEECGDTIEPANRQEIERLAQEVEAALQSEDPETQTGDLERLRQAVEALDEATRPLADLVMDRAMEKMLRQQGLIE